MCVWADTDIPFRMQTGAGLPVTREELSVTGRNFSALPEPMRHAALDAAAVVERKEEKSASSDKTVSSEEIVWEEPIYQWDPWSIHGVLGLPPKKKKERLV